MNVDCKMITFQKHNLCLFYLYLQTNDISLIIAYIGMNDTLCNEIIIMHILKLVMLACLFVSAK